jgi:Zn-finger nucleic acid-binding protein
MASYERSGITVDQCADCRGVLLDRGELDRLLDLEADSGRAPEQGGPDTAGRGADRRKRGGLLGDLFDFGG